MRLAQLAIAFAAVLALVAGSTVLHGAPYWAFTAAVIVAAFAVTWVVYVLRARAWLVESYRRVREAQLGAARARVERELAGQSPVSRPVLELLLAEILLWTGDFDGARAQAEKIELRRLPELWHSGVHALHVTLDAFTGRTSEASQRLYANEQSLRERPGFHELEALIATKRGDAAKARERLAASHETAPRPPLILAALALLRAEIALAHGEPARAFIDEAIRLGGDSFVPKQADGLRSR